MDSAASFPTPASGKSLRIVHVVRAPSGGVLRHIMDLTAIQTAMGYDVGLVCDSMANGSLEEERIQELERTLPLGVSRITIKRGVGVSDLSAFFQVRQALEKLEPDVVHGHGAKGGAFARLAGTKLKKRAVRIYSPHGGSLHFSKDTLSGKIYLGLEKFLERFTDSFIWVSRYEETTYREKIGTPKTRTALIYNGVSDDEFIPVTPHENATDLLFVGHLRHMKGVDTLLDAIHLLHREGLEVTATVVGSGEDRDVFMAQAQRLDLDKHVTFLPPEPVRTALPRGRIMVIPSRAESMPYIVLETVAAQVPVIASAVGGIPEILGDNAPELVAPDAPLLLAQAIRAALSEPDRLYKQAQMQHSRLKNDFSQKVMGEAITNLYEDCIRMQTEAENNSHG